MLDFRPNGWERQNDLELGLEERFYNALNYKDYLENNKFHHSEKGCDIEMRRTVNEKDYNKNWSITKFCKTHNVLCSKTGWELGWYNGSQTRNLFREYVCRNCGKEFLSKSAVVRYCKECRREVSIRLCRENYNKKKL